MGDYGQLHQTEVLLKVLDKVHRNYSEVSVIVGCYITFVCSTMNITFLRINQYLLYGRGLCVEPSSFLALQHREGGFETGFGKDTYVLYFPLPTVCWRIQSYPLTAREQFLCMIQVPQEKSYGHRIAFTSKFIIDR